MRIAPFRDARPRYLPGFLAPTVLACSVLLAWTSPLVAVVDLPNNFEDQLVADGLSQPTGMAFLPDGRIFVIEQSSAQVRLIVGGVIGPTDPILTVPDVLAAGGEQGLLGIAVDPAWPARPFVYLYFDHTPGNAIYLVRYEATGDLTDPASGNLSLGSRYEILTDIPDDNPAHNGGGLRFGTDGMLYVSIGEDDDLCAAQDTTRFNGKILRLNVAALPSGPGGPPLKSLITPADNPFTGSNENAGLVFCYGLRNPFRFHVDPLSGWLYIADVGSSTWEEADEARGGENFGWPFREGPGVYLVEACQESGGPGGSVYDAPIAYYDGTDFTATIISATLYRPTLGGPYSFPLEYNGNYFFADYYEGFVRRIQRSGSTWIYAAPDPGQPSAINWATGIQFVTDWVLGPDGAIYYLKQYPAGEIRRIVYTGPQVGIGEPAHSVAAPRVEASPNPFRGDEEHLRVTVEIPSAMDVRVGVFDLLGRSVTSLLDARHGPGRIDVRWDGRTQAGRRAPSGIYFIRLSTALGESSARVVLLRG